MSKKSIELAELSVYVNTLSTISCEWCNADSNIHADEYDALDYFYEKGWRVIKDKCICPNCKKKIK